MALNPTGIMSIGGPVTGSSINLELTLSATANSNMNQANFRTLAGISSGIITLSNFYGKSSSTATQQAIIMCGAGPAATAFTNLVSSTGVVAANAPTVATAAMNGAASTYGGDKAIYGFALRPAASGISNLISNTGVVAANTPGVGSVMNSRVGCPYGSTGTGMFAYGNDSTLPPASRFTLSMNLISNTGVIATTTSIASGVGRSEGIGVKYGTDTANISYGGNPTLSPSNNVQVRNLVSNTGVIASDIPGVGTARYGSAGGTYGGDKGIYAFGFTTPSSPNGATGVSNLLSNTGVVAANTPAIGAARGRITASGYGLDKAFFWGGGNPASVNTATQNLVSSTGVMAADNATVASARRVASAVGFSFTA